MGLLSNIGKNRTARVQARQEARTERQTARQEARTVRQTARQAQRQASTEAKAAGGKWSPESVAARQAGFAQLGAAGAQLAGSAFMAGTTGGASAVLGALDVDQVGQVLGDVLGSSSSGASGSSSYGAPPSDYPGADLEPIPPAETGIGAWVKENPIPSIAIAGGLFWLLTRKG